MLCSSWPTEICSRYINPVVWYSFRNMFSSTRLDPKTTCKTNAAFSSSCNLSLGSFGLDYKTISLHHLLVWHFSVLRMKSEVEVQWWPGACAGFFLQWRRFKLGCRPLYRISPEKGRSVVGGGGGGGGGTLIFFLLPPKFVSIGVYLDMTNVSGKQASQKERPQSC